MAGSNDYIGPIVNLAVVKIYTMKPPLRKPYIPRSRLLIMNTSQLGQEEPIQPDPVAANVQFSPDMDHGVASTVNSTKKDWRFWCIILAISLSTFTSYLDIAIPTALPVIAHDLNGRSDSFVWVGSAYAISSTAILPLSGGIAQIFGRQVSLLIYLGCFALGSALSGAASDMSFLIGGRTVQGVGSGGIFALTQIVLSDLVPLKDRGVFGAILTLAAMFAVSIAPIVAGGLADHGQWRWLFYLNLFTSGLSASLVAFLLRLKTPEGSLMQKLNMIDWCGTLIFSGASISLGIGLTWAGTERPWGSVTVLVPIILGLFGMIGMYIWESLVATHPLIPFSIMTSWTTISGYLQTFINQVVLFTVVYYLPVYYQACKGASPTHSGIDIFGLSLVVAPMGIVAGVLVSRLQCYRPQMYGAWVLLMIGTGCMSTLKADSSLATSIGFQVLTGVGLGLLVITTYFPVLAPLPVTTNAQALAFFMFCRSFGSIWGITVGGTILQNELRRKLPSTFLAQSSEGISAILQVIPTIKDLDTPIRNSVENAFADSLSVVWQFCIGVSSIGLITCLMMKHYNLHPTTDEKWAMEERVQVNYSRNLE
ncbi:MFS general substrate transporter [Dendrothele bispora CBS 962.96]|uniref:MFS general substrate transporter n=1 Tax=Dendrothele bispora (strain CBS 962.96) TaxID=1314807 RepID=A0A4S8LYS5_DENBC|nr:MFS general substrate transporter [Dendrothele bispora CBS 962.96]